MPMVGVNGQRLHCEGTGGEGPVIVFRMGC